jgi:hypothetical protein
MLRDVMLDAAVGRQAHRHRRTIAVIGIDIGSILRRAVPYSEISLSSRWLGRAFA